ncbi:hypothetical protein B296_00001280 [Ensete ventricosum]|uniref:Uncharacterized protein n=1 Tax=Ensete ventricosum TaxID=4639 RepID=A0A427AVG3_ENSVE|nr:hypothetical protein B296_00001280 [Ensete ventricosum]
MVGNGEQNDSTMYAEREWRGGVSLPFRYPSQQPFRSRMARLPLYQGTDFLSSPISLTFALVLTGVRSRVSG